MKSKGRGIDSFPNPPSDGWIEGCCQKNRENAKGLALNKIDEIVLPAAREQILCLGRREDRCPVGKDDGSG